MKTFYITTPIYYVNDKPHIGHAYTTIAADVLARWKRMQGEPVFFLTGTDEHGSKIALAAEKAQTSPQQFVDELVAYWKSVWAKLEISNDDFVRTTDSRHMRVVQHFCQTLYDRGEIVKGFYEDWYCVSCESFWLESELVNKSCPDCGRPVEKLKEETFFFKLSSYSEKLLEHFQQNSSFLSPRFRSQEIVNFVKQGLKDTSVSRLREKWGVPIPFAPNHTTYVWIDALLNYLTAARYLQEDQKEMFERLWPCNIHFVGKEIYRFHTILWPAMLMALKLPLPQMVFAHGWWTVEGEKMSKSKGNMIDPLEIVNEYGVDTLRYYLLREIPFGADGDFSRKALKTRYNSDLANDLGNLFSRTLTLIEKNFNGTLQRKPEGALLGSIQKATQQIHAAYQRVAFHEVLDGLASVVSEANRYLDQKAPWTLVKTNRDETELVLAECLLALRWLAAGYSPFMPRITRQMWEQLGEQSSLSEVSGTVFENPADSFKTGVQVKKAGVLFPRKDK